MILGHDNGRGGWGNSLIWYKRERPAEQGLALRVFLLTQGTQLLCSFPTGTVEQGMCPGWGGDGVLQYVGYIGMCFGIGPVRFEVLSP